MNLNLNSQQSPLDTGERFYKAVREHLKHIDSACDGKAILSGEMQARYRLYARGIRESRPPEELHPGLNSLANIFLNAIRGDFAASLEEDNIDEGVRDNLSSRRLAVASSLSALLAAHSLKDNAYSSLLKDGVLPVMEAVLRAPCRVGKDAIQQINLFCKEAPSFFTDLHGLSSALGQRLGQSGDQTDGIEHMLQFSTLVAATLRLVAERNMPTWVCQKLTKEVLKIPNLSLQETLITRLDDLARYQTIAILSEDRRLPHPLGRPAALGAVKDYKALTNADIGVSAMHEFAVKVPTAVPEWEYLGHRITAITRGPKPYAQGEELYRYMTQFFEMLAAKNFFNVNEEYFRQITLLGDPSPEYPLFYENTYGSDNPPAPNPTDDNPKKEESSSGAKQDLGELKRAESLAAMRDMALVREGINVRKAYARQIDETGKWLLEEIAEAAGGKTQRLRVQDIGQFPGPGVRISGLSVARALDIATPESKRYHKKHLPWIKNGIRSLHSAELFFMRGFVAISPSFDLLEQSNNRELKKVWRRGSFLGEPYVYLWFNDHFHTQNLPEVRMWLVPAQVFYKKMILAVEHGSVDINQLDVTPEGLVREAESCGMHIFSIGTASVLWGSLANAWPAGKGPLCSWESDSSWRGHGYQDPFHIHRALFTGRYSREVTPELNTLFHKSRLHHDMLRAVVRFGHDLHSSFLSVEEAAMKGYVSKDRGPAQLLFPSAPLPSEGAVGEPGGEPLEPRIVPDPTPEQPMDDMEDLSYSRPRTIALQRLITLRNQIVKRGTLTAPELFPRLELQHTRMFARQEGTPFITGNDMYLHLPHGKAIPLCPDCTAPGRVLNAPVEMTEQMEAAWEKHVVRHFRLKNCPRLVMP